MWQARHALQRCSLGSELGVMHMLCVLYLDLFKGKLGLPNAGVRALDAHTTEDVYSSIEKSVGRNLSIAARMQASFWARARASVHARNVLWTLQYWELLHDYPDPVQALYGFVRQNNIVQIATG